MRNSVACQASAQGSGRSTVATVAVSGHSFSVPAISSATSDSSTPMAAGPMLALSANSASVCASWLASSRQNSRAISRPMPIAEQQAQHKPRRGELGTQNAAGVGQRHDVARRREEQEGDGRADAAPLR